MRCRRLEKQLAHATRLTTMGELAASLAHELNQPLSSILANAQTARHLVDSKGRKAVAELDRVLAEIEQDDRRATEFILHVRGFLKPESGHQTLVRPNHLVKESVELLHSELNRKGIEVCLALAPGLPDILGHPIQLQQVIINLLLNAVEAMSQTDTHERKLVIRTMEDRHRRVRISVRDFGGGISRSHYPRLFRPFFTTKPQGLGIGLVVSRSAVKAHGGHLWAQNNVDRGAVFHVALPSHRKEDQHVTG